MAFSVDADAFIDFVRSLPRGLDHPNRHQLSPSDLIDFDLCWAIDLADPWGNRYELNCYDYDRVRDELATTLEYQRYWPREVYERYIDTASE